MGHSGSWLFHDRATCPDLDSSTPITRTALGMGYSNNENNIVLLLIDHGIGELRQYASARILCIGWIELRMRGNLRQRCANFCKICAGSFRVPLEIPVEGLIDLFLRLRLSANVLPLHPASRARSGASTSSQ